MKIKIKEPWRKSLYTC